MPIIDVKVNVSITAEKQNNIQSKLGEAISILHRPSDYLMINFLENNSVYMANQKVERGGHIAVSFYGTAERADYEKMTEVITQIFIDELQLLPERLFVTFHSIDIWGINGRLL